VCLDDVIIIYGYASLVSLCLARLQGWKAEGPNLEEVILENVIYQSIRIYTEFL
jgi:hypothetical protein